MELLFEEFFGKIWKLINGIYFPPIRIFARLLFYSIFVALFALVGWSVWKNNYTILFIVVGLFIIGEFAHFIRKSMEKASERRTREGGEEYEEERKKSKSKKSKSKSDALSDIDINEKPKNKDLLSDV